jgi:hypothetical protein
METMSNLKFNVDLVKALVKKGTHSTPKATMVRANILNPKGLHYFMQLI